VQDLMQDLRQAGRSLAKAPHFTLVTVATLALGIGANSAIFSVVNAVMLRPLPFPAAERFVHLGWDWDAGATAGSVPAFKYEYWREHTRSFDAMATYRTGTLRFETGDDVQALRTLRVSRDFLDVLGYTPARGRDFLSAEDVPDGPGVVLLTYEAWHARFGGDPGIVDRSLRLDDAPHTVVGVLPESFAFPEVTDEVDALVLLGLRADPRDEGANWPIIARLDEGVTWQVAQSDLDRVTASFRSQHPELVGDRERGMTLASYEELFVGDLGRMLWLVMGAVSFVLLIACANVANLFLARGAQRRREVAVRVALGASRGRIARYVLTESVLLAVVAGLVGLGLATVGVDALLALAPAGIPRIDDVGVDASVLAFTLGAAILTGLAFGGMAAWPAALTGAAESLKDGVRGSSAGGRRAREGLLVAQSALAMLLLVGAGLTVATLWSIRDVDPGFDARELVTIRFLIRPPAYATSERIWELERRVLEELRAEGVVAAAGASSLPFERGLNIPVAIAGRPDDFEGAVEWRGVTPGYFATLGIELVRGRDFTDRDQADAPGVAVVNEAFARRYFPETNPVGQRIEIGRFRGRYIHPAFDVPPLEIVGVAGDVRDRSLKTEPTRTVYVPQSQAQDIVSAMPVFMVRSPRPGVAGQRVVEAVRRVDSRIPTPEVRTVDQLVDASLARERFGASLMGSFAGLALLLTAGGVYGVLAYTVRRRRREIGIRIALGAERASVIRLMTRQGMVPVLGGLALGVAGALALGRVAERLVWGVSPTDPTVIAVVAGILLMVALVASWLPAREASRMDPVQSLSTD